MTTILEKILKEKESYVNQFLMQKKLPISKKDIKRSSLFELLYKNKQLQVIAEIKRASPSKGLIQGMVDPAHQALLYQKSGAACISVLTDTPFFQGSFEDLMTVADTVDIPILCKDFIIHEIQIDFAKSAGASVILLIVAALSKEKLKDLYAYAVSNGLEVLVEVHNAQELDVALQLDAKLIGVNNRDLHSFEVHLTNTAELAKHFPFQERRVLISESGIWTTEDAKRVAGYGASAVLVGEALMRSGEVQQSIRSLQVEREVVVL
ncbi:indole-3-glycerol phosphate synthase TrpC [Psychrobacillus sp. BL-248-WT-3]|uniref:indole-3-glycerol phosphate synthase TrpC n=1 Tax=Psychrobacillus sp. BL-248-WT-3 TaxID=2725306 RepID=UPI00146A6C00|nr:indole-3-glycerol phosphate synthase TrpC [Psychrobacillus sp. BL-248-WT-3]NME05368.1 indole-3-glycerol phosphate synthase TrpC [Psychrobacillus sp. BL-248-WT-3]